MRSPGGYADSDRVLAGTIAAYAPRSLSEAAAAFASEVVARAAPATRARAKALLFAAGRLAAFAEQVGLGLEESLLSEAVIERFVVVGCDGLAPASVRTLRTNLRALARSVARYPEPAPVALVRERAKRPYSQVELAGYLRLADAQSTRARRIRAGALVCLGAGAGIITGELRHVRGSDVVQRSGAVIVTIAGARSRSVPVLERYHERLLEAGAFAGERYLIGGRNPDRRNITDALAAMLSSDSSLPRLQAGRLRSTWLLECAERIGLGAFMHAAGITCSQRLGDLAAQLPAASEPELVRLLGGERR
jgi:integrase